MSQKTKFYDIFCRISSSEYKDFFKEYAVKYGEDFKPCSVCGDGTHFSEEDFGFQVCSIECLEILDEFIAKKLLIPSS